MGNLYTKMLGDCQCIRRKSATPQSTQQYKGPYYTYSNDYYVPFSENGDNP